MRAMRGVVVLALCCAACGGANDPPAVSILLSSDGSHPCAGAVELKATLSELNGDSTEHVIAAAVAPEQFDCDFDVGVAEAVYSVLVGEIEVGVIHTVAIELYDSTGLVVGMGVSETFQARPDKEIDPIELQLSRAPMVSVGTALIDLASEPAFNGVSGEIAIVIEPIGSSRELTWPGDDSLKRPLRISGLPEGFDLFLAIELTGTDSTLLADYETDTFSVGSTESDAFAWPGLVELP